MGKYSGVLAVLLLSGLVAADNSPLPPPPRQKDWNPFQNPFNFGNAGIRNVPAGFGTFPAFPNNGFGSFGGFGNNNNNNGNNLARFSPASPAVNNGGGGFGTWPGFQPFSTNFEDFQKQFSNQFPSFFSPGPAVVPAPAPVDTSNSAPMVVVPPTVAPTVAPTPAPTVAPTAAPTAAPVVVTQPSAPAGSLVVTSRNCTTDGEVIGVSQSPTDLCGSVECQCFKGVYFCYSTCTPPPAGQSCTPSIPTSGADVCPTYDSCSPMANTTDGASEIFRCNGPIHPSVCWLYEILYGKLTEPLGFFESQSQGCPLSNQCVCGTNGFVQPAQLSQADFKTPANNVVFPRTTPGNKGAFASS